VLYCLKTYGESAEASKEAIRRNSNFNSFFILGLSHFATGNWRAAGLVFGRSIELHNPSSWEDEYTEAYYYLGLSSAKLNEVRIEIRASETRRRDLNTPIKRFELANLYLCDGRLGAAKEQYRILRNSDPALAEELLKLIKKHSNPA
jgi:tetratricopeptide (TPR) repeat protein